jgi:hypothetical protein
MSFSNAVGNIFRVVTDRSIRVKLLGSFAVICASLAAVGFVGIHTAQSLKANLDFVAKEQMPSQSCWATPSTPRRASRGTCSTLLPCRLAKTATI